MHGQDVRIAAPKSKQTVRLRAPRSKAVQKTLRKSRLTEVRLKPDTTYRQPRRSTMDVRRSTIADRYPRVLHARVRKSLIVSASRIASQNTLPATAVQASR